MLATLNIYGNPLYIYVMLASFLCYFVAHSVIFRPWLQTTHKLLVLLARAANGLVEVLFLKKSFSFNSSAALYFMDLRVLILLACAANGLVEVSK